METSSNSDMDQLSPSQKNDSKSTSVSLLLLDSVGEGGGDDLGEWH